MLCFPPLHLGLPPFFALVPFALHVEALEAGPAGARSAARAGLVLGAAFFGVLLYWIPVALFWATPVLAAPAYVAVVALLSVVLGLVGWALHRLRRGVGLPLWLALPLVWTAGEWLRGHLPGGLAFPWLGLGTSLTGFPEIVGIAELVGARGVTFWLALTSGLVAEAVIRLRRSAPWRRWAVGVLVVVGLPAGWGVWRADALETRPAGRVAVVQPDVEARVRAGPDRGLDAARRALSTLGPAAAETGPALVVWPETALLRVVPDSVPAGLAADFRAHARSADAPVLLGAYGTTVGPDGKRRRHNSAFVIDAEGVRDFRYHKRRLVPLVERRHGPVKGRAPGEPGPGLAPGSAGPLGRTGDGTAFGVLICFESAFPSLARDYRRTGADVLVNITNDAWFGRRARHARTPALWQHPAHLVMRAVETRAGVVRAANTGISLFVDPTGRVRGRTPLFEPTVRATEVRTTDVRTLYVRLGDWVGPGSVLAVLLGLVAAARRETPVERERPRTRGA